MVFNEVLIERALYLTVSNFPLSVYERALARDDGIAISLGWRNPIYFLAVGQNRELDCYMDVTH